MQETPTLEGSEAVVRVAAAQFAGGDDVSKNLVGIERLATAAARRGATVVVFPEAAMYAWDAPPEDLQTAAVRHADTFVEGLSGIAAATGVTIVAGMFAATHGRRPVNRMIVVGPGGVVTSYDKVHLYDAFHYRESDRVVAGPSFPDRTELGVFAQGPWVFGLLNCYDLRFPEMARLLVEHEVNVLVVSSAWVSGPHKEMHWDTLLRARAIENTCYVVASSQPPPASVGLSMVVDPLGLAAATCPHAEGLAMHDLDPTHLGDVRALVPSVRQRRYPIGGAHQRPTAGDLDSMPQPAGPPGRTP